MSTAHRGSPGTEDTSEAQAHSPNDSSPGHGINSSATTKAQDLTSRALQFISAASNETLGACIVGLGAATYVILGRVGLVIIGVVGGVALHATWESNTQNGTDTEFSAAESRRRREVGLEVVNRVLDWRDKKGVGDSDNGEEIDTSGVTPTGRKDMDFASFRQATGAALTSLTDATVRDYVKYELCPIMKIISVNFNRWWYSPILPNDNTFPSACRRTLTGVILAISSHLSRKRPADTFLNFLTNASSIIIVFLNELSGALMTSAYSDLEASDAVYQYLEANPSSNLANILDTRQQEKNLRSTADGILKTFLDSSDYRCEPVRVFLREIFSGVILESTVRSCSKPEWINSWIVYLLEEGDPELMNAIDAGVGGAPVSEIKKSAAQLQANEESTKLANLETASSVKDGSRTEHSRTVSKAEDAMEEAMLEVKRLNELMAAEEAKKDLSKDIAKSESTTEGSATPTSSQSDTLALSNGSRTSLEAQSNVISPTTPDGNPNVEPSFTSFDQLLPALKPTALNSGSLPLQSTAPPPLTLHNAKVTIFDDSQSGEKVNIRTKPTVDYLLQIEPASSQYSGWMIARKYIDFEALHEVIRRISVVSGVAAFTQEHSVIPGWKNKTKTNLRAELERYLADALSYDRLAESDSMKRFLEKDQGLGRASQNSNKNFAFPSPAAFETVGKGVLDVLASAPKGAAGGGKALLGGVTGVFGSGPKKSSQGGNITRTAQVSSPSISRNSAMGPMYGGPQQEMANQPSVSFDALSRVSVDRGSLQEHSPSPSVESNGILKRSETGGDTTRKAWGLDGSDFHSPSPESELHLPPPPSEISDDYANSPKPALTFTNQPKSDAADSITPAPVQLPTTRSTTDLPNPTPDPPKQAPRENPPLTEQETQVAVELFFAVINELYTLSSAWNIRRTLLNAAKNFLLRPGNPNLEAIRKLLQETVIDANTSDAALAAHLLKLRENVMPTEAELKTWPPPPSAEEKERLRVKARKLLISKGMPQALTSVMGAAASGEALGRVFDCLQVEQVARGFMFALILQGVRAVTQ